MQANTIGLPAQPASAGPTTSLSPTEGAAPGLRASGLEPLPAGSESRQAPNPPVVRPASTTRPSTSPLLALPHRPCHPSGDRASAISLSNVNLYLARNATIALARKRRWGHPTRHLHDLCRHPRLRIRPSAGQTACRRCNACAETLLPNQGHHHRSQMGLGRCFWAEHRNDEPAIRR